CGTLRQRGDDGGGAKQSGFACSARGDVGRNRGARGRPGNCYSVVEGAWGEVMKSNRFVAPEILPDELDCSYLGALLRLNGFAPTEVKRANSIVASFFS